MPSENGWEPAWLDQSGLQWVTVPGTTVSLNIQKGQPLQILRALAADFNAYIAPLRDSDSACYTPTNSVSTSNHLNGTAMDLDWESHAFHVVGTFSADQMRTIRELLDFYEGTIFWAGDWTDPVDEMHWQMGYGSYNNPATQSFIDRKIRSDGFSTFRRGPVLAQHLLDAVEVLEAVMGSSVSTARYTELLPAVSACLLECGCVTEDRIAMWVAQIGHESGGLRYMEELADGSEYEGRTDLGNNQQGDGPRYKGRGPIQVTGRANYTALSEWAYKLGYVPTPTYFVDNPEELASDEHGFNGVTWYWTTQRPMNDAADAKDLERATRYVNGGLNGLASRQEFYNGALNEGDLLLALVTKTTIEDYLMSETLYESYSIYKTPGEGAKYTLAQLIQSIDGMRHRATVEDAALLGSTEDIARVVQVASGHGAYNDPVTINHAKEFLVRLEKENPDALKAYLAQKGAA